mmetsp:Transcript_34701/g.66946  ORF Transcript_34701/g.66946 Transcript_34701/m.66946 type:complete len:140 (-) Transcript_34701:236-655(-)
MRTLPSTEGGTALVSTPSTPPAGAEALLANLFGVVALPCFELAVEEWGGGIGGVVAPDSSICVINPSCIVLIKLNMKPPSFCNLAGPKVPRGTTNFVIIGACFPDKGHPVGVFTPSPSFERFKDPYTDPPSFGEIGTPH